MSRPAKPATQKEIIDQMWYALIGANSEGIAERVKQIDERVRTIESVLPTLMTHREHADYVQGCQDADKDKVAAEKEDDLRKKESDRRQKWRTTDVMLAVLMLLATSLTVVGFFI